MPLLFQRGGGDKYREECKIVTGISGGCGQPIVCLTSTQSLLFWSKKAYYNDTIIIRTLFPILGHFLWGSLFYRSDRLKTDSHEFIRIALIVKRLRGHYSTQKNDTPVIILWGSFFVITPTKVIFNPLHFPHINGGLWKRLVCRAKKIIVLCSSRVRIKISFLTFSDNSRRKYQSL